MARTNTHHTRTHKQVLSIVIKGTEKSVRIKQLEVVTVGVGVAVTFDQFFSDNYVDPNAIDASFRNMIPPNYADTYGKRLLQPSEELQ